MRGALLFEVYLYFCARWVCVFADKAIDSAGGLGHPQACVENRANELRGSSIGSNRGNETRAPQKPAPHSRIDAGLQP